MFWLLKNAVFQGKLTTRIKALLPQCAIVSDVVILKILLCSGISGLESTDQGCPNTRPCVGPDGRGCYKPVSRTLSSVESYLSGDFVANQSSWTLISDMHLLSYLEKGSNYGALFDDTI